MLAEQAKRAGISGVVASPAGGGHAARGAWAPRRYHRHARACVPPAPPWATRAAWPRPQQAFANGASHIVIGRPITQAADPAAAFDAIVAELD